MMNRRLEHITQELSKLPEEKLDQIEFLIKTMRGKVLNLKETAQLLKVSIDTVRRAIKSGRIKAFRLNKNGDYRIPMEELDQFMKEGAKS
ncbi:MAG: helix-turn-helix domain-containing protein [Chlamydiales bacterium]|nr:helix-turn-helix domain-containing protein [Chlamydiales bacterium]MBY0529890.1 helix-turn-helix domain-containing protein [Rhabdochlamydiaceae bacterium]